MLRNNFFSKKLKRHKKRNKPNKQTPEGNTTQLQLARLVFYLLFLYLFLFNQMFRAIQKHLKRNEAKTKRQNKTKVKEVQRSTFFTLKLFLPSKCLNLNARTFCGFWNCLDEIFFTTFLKVCLVRCRFKASLLQVASFKSLGESLSVCFDFWFIRKTFFFVFFLLFLIANKWRKTCKWEIAKLCNFSLPRRETFFSLSLSLSFCN